MRHHLTFFANLNLPSNAAHQNKVSILLNMLVQMMLFSNQKIPSQACYMDQPPASSLASPFNCLRVFAQPNLFDEPESY